MSKHTPVPWWVEKAKKGSGLWIDNADRGICQMVGKVDAEREANARFIVRACNVHEELMAVLELVWENRVWGPDQFIISISIKDGALIKQTLAKAKEES